MGDRLASEKAYEIIKAMILTLELAPGELVTESELAAQTGLGRTPVREALRQLALENLVHMAPRRGTVVAPIQLMDFQQIFELRICLEGLAAQLAAQRATDEDIMKMESIIEGIGRDGPDFDDNVGIDREFHLAIAEAARNKYLASAVENILDLSIRLGYLAGTRRTLASQLIGVYRDAIDALKERDADKARAVMVSHIEDFVKEVRSRV